MNNATKYRNLLLAALALAILPSGRALAGNVRVIANPSVKAGAISTSEIKSVPG